MVSLKSILVQASSLAPAERAELIKKLLDQAAHDLDSSEVEIGHRGLAAWTESTRGESWEAYYPDSFLRDRRTGP